MKSVFRRFAADDYSGDLLSLYCLALCLSHMAHAHSYTLFFANLFCYEGRHTHTSVYYEDFTDRIELVCDGVGVVLNDSIHLKGVAR